MVIGLFVKLRFRGVARVWVYARSLALDGVSSWCFGQQQQEALVLVRGIAVYT